MCPLCISSAALLVAGATSTGAVGTFMARRFAGIALHRTTQPSDPKETTRHDHEPGGTAEDRLAD
jgi:hypothetical protein